VSTVSVCCPWVKFLLDVFVLLSGVPLSSVVSDAMGVELFFLVRTVSDSDTPGRIFFSDLLGHCHTSPGDVHRVLGEDHIRFLFWTVWFGEPSAESEKLRETWWKAWLSLIIKLFRVWLSRPLIIRLFPNLDYHESVILPKTRLKGLILIIKSTYQPWYVTLVKTGVLTFSLSLHRTVCTPAASRRIKKIQKCPSIVWYPR
jgi:hypothetical protein